MKIEPTSPRTATTTRKVGPGAAQGSGSGEFAKALQETAHCHGPQVSMSVGLTGLSTVLALQEAPDATQGRAKRRAKERGEKMLDFLQEIRIGLLTGSIPVSRLEQLAQMVRAKREQVDDPKLHEIMDEIELRAAVELAKLSRTNL